jgi:uroporphyrinogen III methyltransferase/synthase
VAVYLVGAGPGDPGLLTVRGAELLGRADVVVYDRLSVRSLLDLAPASAERINVGKRPGAPTLEQEAINALLVERGLEHDVVVRLKGGDPFVFARGGEEATALRAAGVHHEVVPGVTSAIAVPAYAGIPLTMRHSSELFTVITGHEDPAKGGELDWEAVARLGGTIVVLMGVARLPSIVERLRRGGLAADTPLAVIRWGTRPEQHTVRATLGTVLDRRDELASPSVIVIGRVAALDLDWFESRPLFGRTVVVTRTREQASALAAGLQHAGAATVEAPVIAIAEPDDGGAARRAAAAAISSYDWVVLTSANGVERLFAELRDARAVGPARVAAIGPATAAALEARGIVADLIAPKAVGEALVEAFPDWTGPDAPPSGEGSPGGRVLVARAAVARDVVPDGLRARGWKVDVVDVYRTVAAVVDDEQRGRVAAADAVTFTSSSTVERFLEAFGRDAVPPIVACIGPVTATTAEAAGLHVDVVAPVHTTAGLVAALVDHLGGAGRERVTAQGRVTG